MPKDAIIQYIEKRLYHFLSHSAKLSLDGFVQFRLKEYTALLERAASAAVDVYLAEREYAEFITLLKLFVSTQPSLEAAVHVCAGKTGKYRLFGRDGEEIEKATYADLTDIETLTEEDVLLSVLITLAPREITFHGVQNIGNVRLLETVMKVFDGKVHICEMCTLCKNACER